MVANATAVAMDAIEQFDEFDRLDFEAGLLTYLARDGFCQHLTDLDESAGNGPPAESRLGGSLDEQNAAILHDDSADADQRCERILALQHALTIEPRAVRRIIGGRENARAVYDRPVIDAGQLVNGLWMGCLLILIALAPGIVQRSLDTARNLGSPWHVLRARTFPFLQRIPLTFEPPRWLRWVGVAIILTAVLAFVA